jgi:hypothetical protein
MAIPDPQVVLKIANEIVTAREHLAALQAQWDLLFTHVGVVTLPDGIPDTVPPPRTRRSSADSLTSRLIAFLDANPLCHYEADEIARHLGEAQDKVQRTINKLVFKKKIGRYSRGMYESIIAG